MATSQTPGKSHRKRSIRTPYCRVIAVTPNPESPGDLVTALWNMGLRVQYERRSLPDSMTSSTLLTPRQAAEKIGISYPALKHWKMCIRDRMSSSTEISIMPTLIPDFSGIAKHGYGLPRNPANAVRELAKVLTRMPNHATP